MSKSHETTITITSDDIIFGSKKHTDISAYNTINASNLNIQDSELKLICRYLQQGDITKLVLNGNQISDTGVQSLISSAKHRVQLKEINLSDNNISDTGAKLLITYVETNPFILKINLSNNKVSKNILTELEYLLIKRRIDKDVKEQEPLVNTQKLSLHAQKFKLLSTSHPAYDKPIKPEANQNLAKKIEKGKEPEPELLSKNLEIKLKEKDKLQREFQLHYIAGALKKPDCLIQSLKIKSQQLTDSDLLFLCNGIANNTSLVKLNLQNNKLSIDGIRVLNETLKNHIFCKIASISLSGNVIGLTDDIDTPLNLDRFIKQFESKTKVKIEEKQQPIAIGNGVTERLSILQQKAPNAPLWADEVNTAKPLVPNEPTKTNVERLNVKSEAALKTFPCKTPIAYNPNDPANKDLTDALSAFTKAIERKMAVDVQKALYAQFTDIIKNSKAIKFDQMPGKISAGDHVVYVSFKHPAKDITIECITDPKGGGIAKINIKNGDKLRFDESLIFIGAPYIAPNTNVEANLSAVLVQKNGANDPIITKNDKRNFEIGAITLAEKEALRANSHSKH